ncbi:Conserved_hypothetical protein [Hexamita inflata]|uniref:Uncharacterized protein n=1 Tax=Hexamita inflata TaxID=28002 RepID=A0ABP1H681_9EUKA
MKRLFNATMNVTKKVIDQLTANDNYNCDKIVLPLHNFATEAFDQPQYNQTIQLAIKGLQLSKTYFESEQFQFKQRLIDQIISTTFLERIQQLVTEVSYYEQAFNLLACGVDICASSCSERYYVLMLQTAAACARNPTPVLLNAIVRLLEVNSKFTNVQIPVQLLSSVIQYAQVSSSARLLIYNKIKLFDRVEVEQSCLAGLKNELIKVDSESCENVSFESIGELLRIISSYKDFTPKTIREIINVSFELIFILINRVSFDGKIGDQKMELLKDQNSRYTGEMLGLSARVLQILRQTHKDLYIEACKQVFFQNKTLFYAHSNTSVKQINNLLQEDLQFTIPQQIIIQTLNQKFSPTSLLPINSILNLLIQFMAGSHLTTNETKLQSGSDLQRTRIQNALINLYSFSKNQPYINGDLVAENAKYNRIAQFSCGMLRHELYQEITQEMKQQHGLLFCCEPVYHFILEKISEICGIVMNNDFNGDEGAEVIMDAEGKEIKQYAFQFDIVQIKQLKDFYMLATQFLYQIVLVNPYFADIVSNSFSLIFDSIKKLNRFVAFIKANRTVFLGNEVDNEWIKSFDELLQTVIEYQKMSECAATGFAIGLIKGL